ncbi:MAG: response regulator [Clostridia bacterium]|nr:response regulator [Clostridia bacterium]
MNGLQILVVDSSAVYKKMYAKAVAEVDGDAFLAFAASGDEALGHISRADFDIIIIDMEISEPQVARLLGKISKIIPKAFVLVTARPSPANHKLLAEALNKGAADCMTKPIYSSYEENITTIKGKMASILRTLSSGREKMDKTPVDREVKRKKAAKPAKFRPELVLVAASTGGPSALEVIFSQLSKDFPIPILVVQHMPSHFTGTLAENLNHKSELSVKVAESNEIAMAGTVYIAPGGLHMKLDAKSKIHFDTSPPLNGIRPAADVLFESVAQSFRGAGILVVILTGMGSDGEKGVAALKQKQDCVCLAQSEKTCVVYGMPRVVAESGFADKVLDLEQMPMEIEGLCHKKG